MGLSSHCKNGVLQSRNVQGQKVEESGQAGEWVVSGLIGGDRKLESSRRSSQNEQKKDERMGPQPESDRF